MSTFFTILAMLQLFVSGISFLLLPVWSPAAWYPLASAGVIALLAIATKENDK